MSGDDYVITSNSKHTDAHKAADDLDEQVTQLRALLVLINQEYDLSGSWIGNGCEHGFKPAAACPNAGCRVAQIQQAWDRIVTPNVKCGA